jgi:hypothetical protein
VVPQGVIIGLLKLLEYINDRYLRCCYSHSFSRRTWRCAAKCLPTVIALSTTGTGNVRAGVCRRVSLSCFGSHISDKCILNYVTDQATNEDFLSLADPSFLDDVSQSSVVKNYIETN